MRTDDTNLVENQAKRWRGTLSGWISFIAVGISFIAVVITFATFSITFWPWGTVGPIQPSAYAIVRGVKLSSSEFPSDHLVIPLEWENNKGRSILVRQPELILTKVGGAKDKGSSYRFVLAGEYPNASAEAFSKPYALKNSLVLQPHSVSLNILVFHVEDWFDPNAEDYDFRFTGDTKYRVELRYLKNSETDWQKTQLLSELPINKAVEQLSLYGTEGQGWDYYYLPPKP